MRVYIFYNPIKGYADPWPLIDLWCESWAKNGWDTRVLSEVNAADNPFYKEFCDKVDSLPTANSREYEHACYVRWLAMAELEDSVSVLSDYDVINRSFTPSDAQSLIGGENIVFLEPTRVPCAVIGTPKGFSILRGLIENYEVSLSDRHNGKPHVSDMEIFRKDLLHKTDAWIKDKCVEHLCSGSNKRDDLGDGWKTAPLIHFSTYSFMKLGLAGKHPKEWLIRNALAKL